MLNWLKRKAAPPASSAPVAAPACASGYDSCKQRGNVLLDQGRLEEAAQCYRDAIALDAAPAAAHINLGYVLTQLGRNAEARAELEIAALAAPAEFDIFYMLGDIERADGRFAQAVHHDKKALALNPDFLPAWRNLCTAQFLAGRVDDAAATAREGIARFAQAPDFHVLLGNILAHRKDHDGAADSYRRALSIQPGNAQTLNNLGVALRSARRLDEALQSFEAALAAQPDYTEALRNLGDVLVMQERPQEALDIYARVLASAPKDAALLHCASGDALQSLGRLKEAVDAYDTAIRLQPGLAQAHSHRSVALVALDRTEAAIESGRRAVALQPDSAEAHNNLGNALEELSRFDEAVAHYQTAIRLDAGYAAAHSNLGVVLQEQGHHEAAVQARRTALELDPDFAQAHSNLLFALCFHPDYSPADYLREAREYGRRVADAAQHARHTRWPHVPAAGQPLRVGLVSGDLRMHPVGYFLEDILASLDPASVELYTYSTHVHEDGLTERIKRRFARWTPIFGLGDDAAASRIHADGVQVLVDLAGHTAFNRLPVFARRPAPVQASWLGYFASTGLPQMDFLLADDVSVPPAHREDFSERLWYLPDTRLCFSAPGAPGGIGDPHRVLPALRNGYVTFGCFQNMKKLSDEVLALWSRILAAVPRSRLRLQSKQMADASSRELLLSRLESAGIARERVQLDRPTSRDSYLLAHHQVDMLLDTFPFPGGTTTCEALWMGVPTVTLAGQTLLSRQGASLLSCAGLPDWIAADADRYVEIAVAKAQDLQALAQLRAGLREQVLGSALFDAPRFAKNLQEALHGMWRQREAALAGDADGTTPEAPGRAAGSSG